MNPPVLVIGFGNPLRGDDAVGQEVAQILWAERESLPVLDCAVFTWGHQLTPEMAPTVASAGSVVFLDAAQDGRPAGTVTERAVRALGTGRAPGPGCWQDMSPSALLTLASELYGAAPPAVLVTVSVGKLSLSEGLSVPVRAAVPKAAAAALGAIAALRTRSRAPRMEPEVTSA